MTDTDFGPLQQLIGQWYGGSGIDVSPDEGKEGHVDQEYRESLVVEPVCEVTNAESQTLSVVRYHQVVTRLSDGEVFHDEMGYYHYDQEAGLLSCSFCIPRGVAVHAAGMPEISDGGWKVTLNSVGVAQSEFMANRAKTVGFRRTLAVTHDELRYQQQTDLHIYGRSFDHTDQNSLERQG